jgi:FkbM family methyltransferase
VSLLGALARRLDGLHPRLDAELERVRSRRAWKRFRRGDAALRLVDALVRPGDFVVDIGAADGLYTARLSELVGREGRVYAFEPNPAQFAKLEALGARYANVTTYQLGLSDQAGEAELHVPVLDDDQRHGLGSLSVPAARTAIDHRLVPVPLERLDALLPAETAAPAFLKCDVEGHEFAVLRGAEETLRRSRPVILVEIEQRHQDGPIQATFDYLGGVGYSGYSLHEDGLRPLEEFSVARDQLAYLDEGFQEAPAEGYVHDFVFVPHGTDIRPLAAAVEAAG